MSMRTILLAAFVIIFLGTCAIVAIGLPSL